MRRLRSQARVERRVDVGAQRAGVDWRQASPTLEQLLRADRSRWQRAKLGDGSARARDRDLLAAGRAVDDLPAELLDVVCGSAACA